MGDADHAVTVPASIDDGGCPLVGWLRSPPMPLVRPLAPDPRLASLSTAELADELEAAYDIGESLPPAVVFEVLRRALRTDDSVA